MQTAMYQRIEKMPKEPSIWYGCKVSKALKKSKRGILAPLETAYCGQLHASSLASAAWRLVRIQWRASETVGRGSINSFDHNRPSTRLIPSFVQSPSCTHSLLRSFIRLHGVNHDQPFPTATNLQKIFTSFTILQLFSALAFGMLSQVEIIGLLRRGIGYFLLY